MPTLTGVNLLNTRKKEITQYVGYENNSANSVTVHWHTISNSFQATFVEYRKQGETNFKRKYGTKRRFPSKQKNIHWVEIDGLDSSSIYEIKLLDKIHKIKTLSENPQEIKIAIGGDYQIRPETWERMAKTIGMFSPDFHVAIGDLASCDGVNGNRWEEFWRRIEPGLIDSDGAIIPLITGLGNHDVEGGYGQTKDKAPFYYSMFSFPQDGYGSLDFGNLLRILILDTGHTVPIEIQTDWIKSKISDDFNHVIPIMHIQPYPVSTTKNYGGSWETKIREEWCSEFEADNNVKAVFEGHNHCWGKTIEIGYNTRYFGGGALGVGGAAARLAEDTWYLEDSAGTNHNPENTLHFYLVTVTPNNLNIKAINIEGNTFDEVNL